MKVVWLKKKHGLFGSEQQIELNATQMCIIYIFMEMNGGEQEGMSNLDTLNQCGSEYPAL